METRVRWAGLLNIVFGSAGAVISIALLFIFGGVSGLMALSAEDSNVPMRAIPVAGVVAVWLVTLTLLVSAPLIVAGFGVLHFRPWARVLIIIISALNLLNLPLGTVVGMYSLSVMLSVEADYLFQDPPIMKRR
jgi:hypothetical protein